MPPHATTAAHHPPAAAAAAPAAVTQPSTSRDAAMQSTQQPYRVGSYIIREEIGRGSFATVYRGEKTVSERGSGMA